MKYINKFFAFILVYFSIFSVQAANFQQTDKVAVELISAQEGINPTEKVSFIIKFIMKNGWHIFSDNPGEIGMPTSVDWTLPDGYNIIKEQWSIGEDFETDGIIQNGYGSIAYYKVEIQPSPDIWGDVHFKARVGWLACKGECVPESLRFEFDLPIVHTNNYPSAIWQAENALALQSFEMMPNIQGKTPHLIWIVFMAFMGGLILNFMPCIFPVLSLKAISLAHGSISKKQAKAEALLYFVGVVISFIIMATILMILRLKGEHIGWGFQLQSPVFVGILIVIFTLIFLTLLDFIKIRLPWVNKIGRLSVGQKKFNAFMTGFLAVLIASPCTAPFMGVAIGYTLTQPIYIYYPIFLALSIGYALPFSLIALFPKMLHRILPKPGKWMEILKKIFAIPIFLTCIWLFWVLQNQLNGNQKTNNDIVWENYNLKKIETLLSENKPVFIDFTAKWCITCLLNEKIALSSKEFANLVENKNITLFKADWTNRDAEISQALQNFGRNSVPLYIYYDGTGGYKILPQILTPDIVRKSIN